MILFIFAFLSLICFFKYGGAKFIQEGLNLAARSFGFQDMESMVSYTLIISNKLTTVVVFSTSAAISLLGFMEKWVFAPFYTYAVFMCLMLAEAILGTIKAIYFQKEKFNWDKFVRIAPKFLAHNFALMSAFHMAKAEELFSWMPSTIFIFFGIQNFMKSIMHLVDMKFLEGSFASFMKEKFSQNNDMKSVNYEDEQRGD